ncbi:metallophosphoesterase family protein [Botrimarina mediterranea]|uniref:metallophosphoesterase family protein n=1 Tax=Botrimarina mediterranea TaxID=2528022 RepID=UPI00118882D3|nr:putative metallophosphoesterase YhaO [Planctomycetes bacterium K2D]
MFKFLHAADIHLDSPLRGLDRYEGAPADQIRGATRRAFENLVEVALREEVALVVLAGDLYDGDWRDFNTGLFFVKQMARLKEAGIPVYAVNGNHDATSRITRRLPLPENVHVFPTGEATTIRLEGVDVAIHGQSFAEQCTTEDLAKNYPAAVSGVFNLGVLHTSMTGRDGHGSYAPCSEACLRDRGYDYWALGHIHQREVLSGATTIAYPGNIQGRHIRETGPKGCLVVHVDDNLAVDPVFEPLDVLRWEVARVGLEGAGSSSDAIDRVGDAISQVVEQTESRFVAVRVVLEGATSLSEAIAAAGRQWVADIRALALDIGAERVWLEKVVNQTTPPVDARPSAEEDTPRAEVASLVGELLASATAGADIGVDLSDLQQKLPSELSDALRTADSDWWRDVLGEARSRLLAELKG